MFYGKLTHVANFIFRVNLDESCRSKGESWLILFSFYAKQSFLLSECER